MKKFHFTLKSFVLFVVLLTISSLTHAATATRTWVAKTNGDDAAPCSRTAPCLTFAGAITKTSEGGEIDVLDPGSYGSVTITKAITIDGGTGSGWASILATENTDGVIINVTAGANAANADVVLRNLSINGAKQAPGAGGDHGITIIKGFQVHVQNVDIQNFANEGINVDAADSVSLFVENTGFTRDTTAIQTTTTSGFVTLQLNHLSIQGSVNGVRTVANTRGNIRDSYFGGNSSTVNGAVKVASGCTINMENNMFASNEVAVNVDAGGTARISDNCFFNNSVALQGAGTIATATNTNKFAGNSSDGVTPNDVIVLK